MIASLVLVMAGLLPGTPAGAEVPRDPGVTRLPTGDQVLTTAAGTVLRPGPGRERITVADYRVAGRHYVIPRDAGPTDPSAFEVTAAATLPAGAGEHRVRLSFVGRDGLPAARAEAMLVNLSTGEYHFADAATELDLPADRYALTATVYGEGTASMLVQPLLEVTAPADLVLDARVARPIDVRVPRASARPAAVVARFERSFTVGDEPRSFGGALTSLDGDLLHTAHLGPAVPADGFHASVKVNLAEPGPDGGFAASPYQYSLLWGQDGRMWTGLREWLTDHRGLATVRAEHADLGLGRREAVTGTSGWFGDHAGDLTLSVPIALPHARTEYYSTGGAHWSTLLCHYPPGDPRPEDTVCLTQDPVTYQPGTVDRQRWNAAPFLPAAALVERLENRLRAHPSFTDSAGHGGGLPWAGAPDARLRLYRDGVLVGETGLDVPAFTDLPPEPARYRLEVEADFASPDVDFRAAWTFTSGYAPIGEGRLPVTNVWLEPELGADNRAPAGRPLAVPIRVDRTPATGPALDVSLDVSFDAGATWRPATVVPASGGWRTVITPPADAEHVSVRTRTSDASGDTSEQTVIRAWALTRG